MYAYQLHCLPRYDQAAYVAAVFNEAERHSERERKMNTISIHFYIF